MALQEFLSVIFFTIFIYNGETRSPGKIFGGEIGKPGDLPWVARIQVRFYNWGGTIITEKHILTRALLIEERLKRPYKDANVTTGSINYPEGEVHHIRHATIHPKFIHKYPESITYDVGIITLCHWMDFNSYQRPAQLPSRDVQDGEKAIIGGFGLTEEGGLLPDVMHKVTVTVYGVETCNKSEVGPFDDRSRICTIDEIGKGYCNGDGGNALVIDGDIVVGVASERVGECGTNKDIYANVYECLDYIEAEIHPLTCIKPMNFTTVRTIQKPLSSFNFNRQYK